MRRQDTSRQSRAGSFQARAETYFACWRRDGICRRWPSAALLLLFTWIRDPVFAMVVMSSSSFVAEFSGPISWTSAMDMGGEHVGTVSGWMNMLGHFGGSVAPAVAGLLLSWSGNAWTTVFYCSAAIYAAGALCWTLIDSDRLLDLT
jgi:MFS transporter, ACS family, glucarate transporter